MPEISDLYFKKKKSKEVILSMGKYLDTYPHIKTITIKSEWYHSLIDEIADMNFKKVCEKHGMEFRGRRLMVYG